MRFTLYLIFLSEIEKKYSVRYKRNMNEWKVAIKSSGYMNRSLTIVLGAPYKRALKGFSSLFTEFDIESGTFTEGWNYKGMPA